MGVIEEAWLSYSASVIPATAHASQRSESRRAFYAGAQALFSGIMRGLDEDHEPTPEDLAHVDKIAKELDAHWKAVAGGRA